MYFDAEVTTRDFPQLLRQVIAITGWRPWNKRLRWLAEQAQHNVVMPYFLTNRFELEIAFANILRNSERTGAYSLDLENSSERRFLSLVVMVANCYKSLNVRGQSRLKGMLRDALKSDEGLGPLAYEMKIAAHLLANKYNVTFNDLETGKGYDYLAKKNGIQFEIECKYITGDIGRKIHSAPLHKFFGLLQRQLQTPLDELRSGLLVRLTIPDRLSGTKRQHDDLCQLVRDTIRKQKPAQSANENKTFLSQFDIEKSPIGVQHPTTINGHHLQDFLSTQYGIENKNVLVIYSAKQAAIVVAVESAKEDQVLRSIYEQLKASARKQFSRLLPGILCCHLADLTGQQLRSLGKDNREGVALDYMSTELLQKRPHLLQVTYTVDENPLQGNVSTELATAGSYREWGTTYTVRSPEHPFAEDSRYSIF